MRYLASCDFIVSSLFSLFINRVSSNGLSPPRLPMDSATLSISTSVSRYKEYAKRFSFVGVSGSVTNENCFSTSKNEYNICITLILINIRFIITLYEYK